MGKQRTCLCMVILMSVALYAAPKIPVPVPSSSSPSSTAVIAATSVAVVSVAAALYSTFKLTRVQRSAEEQLKQVEETVFQRLAQGPVPGNRGQWPRAVQEMGERILDCEVKIAQMRDEMSIMKQLFEQHQITLDVFDKAVPDMFTRLGKLEGQFGAFMVESSSGTGDSFDSGTFIDHRRDRTRAGSGDQGGSGILVPHQADLAGASDPAQGASGSKRKEKVRE